MRRKNNSLKVVSRVVAAATREHRPRTTSRSTAVDYHFVAPPKTDVDVLYDIIYDKCRYGYRFTDSHYGMPWIERAGVEKQGENIFVLRFRCPPEYLAEGLFFAVAKEVCAIERSQLHFMHEVKHEFGIPFEVCAWVICVGECDKQVPEPERQTSPEEEKSAEESLSDRFAEAFASFV